MNRPCSFDVAVLGAGPAGSTCALQLARQGCSVLLVHHESATLPVGESLPPMANRLLKQLDLEAPFRQGGHQACFGNLSAWGGDRLQSVDFIRDPDGHGWQLNRTNFDQMLRDAAMEAGVFVLTSSCRSTVPQRIDAGWRLAVVEDGSTVESKWLVDATGIASTVACAAGARRESSNELLTYSAIFEPDEGRPVDSESVTLVEARRDGWWYTARLPNGIRVAVFFTDPGNHVDGPHYLEFLQET
ncbi:MAG TPA: NAD(P)/FAD-dependent oxidoreductase, partial [Bryobacteraceae bacterium]|nr:NAD(P)/FAD-dependent oxidoreductase [Bryobacteraceae bacterium]